MNAGNLMDPTVITLRRDATLSEIYAVMSQSRQTDFPVIDAESQLVGMLYEEDLLKALEPAFQNSTEGGDGFTESAKCAVQSLTLRAEEMMTPALGWVSTETEISKLALVMREKKVRCLPVFGSGKVIGLVTERAIFMALLQQSIKMKQARMMTPAALPTSAASMKERRRHPRKGTSFKLAYKKVSLKLSYKPTDAFGNSAAEQARIAKCLNLSVGGMLVQADEPFDADDVLDVAFEIPFSKVAIRRLARVTRCMSHSAGHYQLGLFFLALSIQEIAALDAYLKTLPDS